MDSLNSISFCADLKALNAIWQRDKAQLEGRTPITTLRLMALIIFLAQLEPQRN
jgi:hypothetical protein